jgi:hypothetical protein
MAANPALSALASALAEIYSDDASIRRLARESDLSLKQIAFDARAINTWSSILTEAQFQGKVETIIEIAQREYPAATDLLAAAAAYRAGRAPAPVPPPVQPSSTPRRPTEEEKRTLAQALLQCEAMSSRAARESVVGCLPAQIRQRIKYGPNDLIDAINIVTAAANFPDGLRQLIDCVRQFEGATFAMQDVERLAAPFV